MLARSLGPDVTSWRINTEGQTGYGGIASNVQLVQYSITNVYVSCTCIPGYDIGPWAGNPNTPANQNFTFKITRMPQLNGPRVERARRYRAESGKRRCAHFVLIIAMVASAATYDGT